ncbi:hypothetical protein AVEN_206280-1, partial [Araneus ventricosus]
MHQFELSWRTGITDSLVKCELSRFIHFPPAERNTQAEIHRRISRVYGENCYAILISPARTTSLPNKQSVSRFSWRYSNGVGMSYTSTLMIGRTSFRRGWAWSVMTIRT